MPDTVLVTGVIDLDPANRDAAIEAFNEVMAPTLQEEGCEHYAFTADVNDPGRFHVSERWSSADAMNAHMATPHLAALMGKMGGLGVTGASLTKWSGATGEKIM